MKRLILPLAIACAPSLATAEPLFGNQLTAGIHYLSLDGIDTDSSWGLTGGATFFLNDLIYIHGKGDYKRVSAEETFSGGTYKETLSITTASVGPGVELGISDVVSLFAEGAFGLANLGFKYSEPGNSGSTSESGSIVSIGGGMRFKIEEFSGSARVTSSQINISGFDSDWEMTFGFGANYLVSANTTIGFETTFTEDMNTVGLVVGYTY